jgi:alpha-1,3-fucosyltransferase
VDIYGGCGDKVCPKGEGFVSTPECYDNVEQNYKFYLSFENSVCEDYVTEKYYNVMERNILPVTYNGANMSFYGPPHSSINALDFQSVEALADYLLEVCTTSI